MEQAACLSPMLRRKTRHLALRSGGGFWSSSFSLDESISAGFIEAGSPTFLRFASVTGAAAEAAEAAWWGRVGAGLKPADRALEKLLRCYDCDTSRLVDCCRQNILYADPAGVLEGLRALAADSELEVLRVKNRMDPAADSRPTAGFRNVVVNMRIKTQETRQLGVDMHVCELQLTLAEMARCSVGDAHERYLVLRNCRDASTLYAMVTTAARSFLTYFAPRPTVPVSPSDAVATLELLEEGVLKDGRADRNGVNGHRSVDVEACTAASPPQLVTAVLEGGGASFFTRALSKPAENRATHARNGGSGTGQSIETAKEEMMKEQFRESMTSRTRYDAAGDPARGRWKLLHMAGSRRLAAGDVWETDFPLSLALTRPWMLPLLLIIAACLIVGLAANSLLIWRNIAFTATPAARLRLTVLELAGTANASSPTARAVGSFGMLRDGCPWELGNLSLDRNDRMVLVLPEPIPYSGWFLRYAAVAPDPARFMLERWPRRDASAGWEPAGASWGWWTWSGMVVWDALGGPALSGGLTHNGTEVQDSGVPAWWAGHRMAVIAVDLVLVAALWAALAGGQGFRGKRLVEVLSAGVAGVDALFAGLYFSRSQWRIGVVALVFAVTGAALPATMVLAERWIRHWLGLAGVVQVAAVLLHELTLAGSPGLVGEGWQTLFRNRGLLQGFICVLLSLWAAIARHRAYWAARNSAEPHRAALDSGWAKLQSAHATALEELRDFALRLSDGLSADGGWPTGPRQPLSEWAEAGELRAALGARRVARSVVHRLEQLLAQSAGLDIFLRERVKVWAAESSGRLLIGYGETEAWERLATDGRDGQVRWAALKGRERAADKLVRCYRMDPSRLLDCCRQRIYYDDPVALLRGFQTISQDPAARIARITNRLTGDYKAVATAGYRDVRVNLALDTEDTRRMGLQYTLCELQLALVPLAVLQTEEDHARYVTWRNLRDQ